jgi:hypothetical protein
MKRKIFNLLFEQDDNNSESVPEDNVESSNEPKARKSHDSVDDQIDSLILLYEKRSIREVDDLFESLKHSNLKYLIEQEEEAEDAPEDAPADEAETADETETGSDEPVGSEKLNTQIAKEQAVPDLDIDQFTIKVARLIMNHRNLLQIENAIINRTKNFLDENYGDKFVLKYLDILEEQFGITTSEYDISYDEELAPFAIGANPAGAGMSGGG